MLELGTMLSGRYEVLKRVGSGGMADVYMAKDYPIKISLISMMLGWKMALTILLWNLQKVLH